VLEESEDMLLDRIMSLAKFDATVCKILMAACAGHPDDETAELIMKRVREHTSMSRDPEAMYDVDHYLDYVKDLVDLSHGFDRVRPIKLMYEKIRDTYEVLLYNKSSLEEVLEYVRQKEQIDAMRENYWKN
jgi:hypothetical protein